MDNKYTTQTQTYVLDLNDALDVVLKKFMETLNKNERVVSTNIHENKLIVVTEKLDNKKVLLG